MNLANKTSDQLKRCIERFPYYQTARLLYLKTLKECENSDFCEAMQKTVLYVSDNESLYSLSSCNDIDRKSINEDKGNKNVFESNRGLVGDANVGCLKVIEKSTTENDILSSTDPQESVSQEGKAEDTIVKESNEESLSTQEKQQRSNIVRQTTDYVSYMLQEISVAGDGLQREDSEKPLKGQHLIDDFIKNGSAHISLQNEIEYSPEGLMSQESELVANEEDYFTETLAKIYIKQGRYDKALEIIRKLMANYPKKNSYFADQIRFLEKLIINNKNKN